jgi:hypothetical protein
VFGRLRPRPQGDAPGDLVQVAGQRLAFADGASLFDEDEEGGLEGVLDVLDTGQQAPADVEDQRRMPPDEHLEGRIVPPAREAFQQLGVAEPPRFGRRDAVQLMEESVQLSAGHASCSLWVVRVHVYCRDRRPGADSITFRAAAGGEARPAGSCKMKGGEAAGGEP